MILRSLEWSIIGLYIVLGHREQSLSDLGLENPFPQEKISLALLFPAVTPQRDHCSRRGATECRLSSNFIFARTFGGLLGRIWEKCISQDLQIFLLDFQRRKKNLNRTSEEGDMANLPKCVRLQFYCENASVDSTHVSSSLAFLVTLDS